MMTKTLLITLSLISGNALWAQKIKSDDFDKKTKVRTIETTDEKISDITVFPQEGKWEDTKFLNASIFSVNNNKLLKLDWINGVTIDYSDVDSVSFISNDGKKESLLITKISSLGRKLSMTNQMAASRYANTLYLSGNISQKISKIEIMLKDKSHLIAILNSEETRFLYQAHLLISNIVGS